MSTYPEEIMLAGMAEESRRLYHANRLYAVLSAVNRTMTRKPGRKELVQEICQIMVEIGGFRMAWFGTPDAEGWVVPKAIYGDTLGYIAKVRISILDIPEGRGPTGVSLRENRPLICANIPTNPYMLPWREQAAQNGFSASACFPVPLPDGATGGLTLYSSEADFFSTDEEKLLIDIANDIGYALEFIAAEEQRSIALMELRHSQQALERTQAIARIGGWSADLLSGLSTNSPEASRVNGLPTAPISWKQFFDLVHPEDLPRFQKAWQESMAAIKTFDIEIRITVRGVIKWIHNLAEFETDATGRPVRVVGFIQDVTEQKQIMEAAEAANLAKNRFLANMSHELRTPMNGLLGMIQLTQQDTLSKEQRELLDLALASGNGLIRVLDDILDLSRIEAGRVTLEKKPFDLNECVTSIATLLHPEALRKDLKLTVTLDKQLPSTVSGDRVRLRQVLTNLIGNAIKFTLQGTVLVQVTQEPEGITFTVSDTGIGIPEEKCHLLFKPFSQVDDSFTRNYGGTGLGLAISQEIVELMGGRIIFDSCEGFGSSFSFTLPFETRKDGSAPPPFASTAVEETTPTEAAAVHPPRILVVEDELINRTLLQMGLGRKNFQVGTAENGQEALEKLAQQEFDLILMDVQMPIMDGISTTQAIREIEREKGGHIPILAVTAFASSNDKECCLNAGMDRFLTKPVNLDEVVQVIGELLQGGQS